jgi:hypothetical protein
MIKILTKIILLLVFITVSSGSVFIVVIENCWIEKYAFWSKRGSTQTFGLVLVTGPGFAWECLFESGGLA